MAKKKKTQAKRKAAAYKTKPRPTSKRRTTKSSSRSLAKLKTAERASAKRRTTRKRLSKSMTVAATARAAGKPKASTAAVYQLTSAGYPWGSLGSLLWNGTGRYEGGALLLQRTAPFVPPISEPAGFVVTDAVRQSLELSALTGFAFRPVRKEKIVRLDWSGWDRSAKRPSEWPADQQPMDFMAGQPHDPELSSSIGELHELVSSGGMSRAGASRRSSAKVAAQMKKGKGVDICVDGEGGPTYVSERARRWFVDRFDRMLKFALI